MKTFFSCLTDLLASLAFAGVAAVFLTHAWQDIRQWQALRDHGVRIDARLQNAAHHHRRWWFDHYTLTVAYLHESRALDVNADIFAQYIQGDRFSADNPVAIAYLPDEPHIARPVAQLEKSPWRQTETLTRLAFGSLFLLLALIFFPRNPRKDNT